MFKRKRPIYGYNTSPLLSSRGFIRDMPLFFKLWFAFVFSLVVAGIALQVFVGVKLYDAGPEGAGRFVGSFLKGVQDVAGK